MLFAISPNAIHAAGTATGAFLEIPVGAGPAAMGSAYSALATDAYAPVWNPAGLGFVHQFEIAGQHLAYLESIHHEFVGVAVPLGERSAIGASLQYLGSGSIPETDINGSSIGDYSDSFGAYSLSYGRRFGDRLALGLTGKYIHLALADESAQAFAMDAGALYKITPKVTLAATVTNVGSEVKFLEQKDPLPLSSALGMAYSISEKWLVSAEARHDSAGGSGRLGLEWTPIQALSLRSGYRTDTAKELSALAGFSAGIGVRLWGQELSYAWVPRGDLGNTQYVSMVIRWGSREEHQRSLRTGGFSRGNFGSDSDLDPEKAQMEQLLKDRAEERR